MDNSELYLFYRGESKGSGRAKVICPKSQSWSRVELGLEIRFTHLQSVFSHFIILKPRMQFWNPTGNKTHRNPLLLRYPAPRRQFSISRPSWHAFLCVHQAKGGISANSGKPSPKAGLDETLGNLTCSLMGFWVCFFLLHRK